MVWARICLSLQGIAKQLEAGGSGGFRSSLLSVFHKELIEKRKPEAPEASRTIPSLFLIRK
jgi:hypothetical protein